MIFPGDFTSSVWQTAQKIYDGDAEGAFIGLGFTLIFREFIAFFETFHYEGANIIDSLGRMFMECEVIWWVEFYLQLPMAHGVFCASH